MNNWPNPNMIALALAMLSQQTRDRSGTDPLGGGLRGDNPYWFFSEPYNSRDTMADAITTSFGLPNPDPYDPFRGLNIPIAALSNPEKRREPLNKEFLLRILQAMSRMNMR